MINNTVRIFFIFLSFLMAGAAPVQGQSIEIPDPSLFPSLISSTRIDAPLDFCGEPVPMDQTEIRERLEKEILLAVWNRPQVILWVKRSGRYMPYIERLLKQNNMPDDLKYVAFVESALLPHIGSSKGAVGYWQFIRSTGLRYGLRIDKNVDERRSIFTSTQAAIRYFKKLHGDFGSWTLAAAAYNMGEHGLQRNISEQKTRDYYNLYLPMETQRYIYKILASKLILSDLPKYGFNLKRSDLYAPVRFDRVSIQVVQTTPLQLVAEAAGTYFKAIKDLNPQIRGKYLTGGTHSLLIPEGTSRKFLSKFKTLSNQYHAKNAARKASRKKVVYVVKKGDYLSHIADKFNVSLNELLRWNKLRASSPIHPGKRLVIFR